MSNENKQNDERAAFDLEGRCFAPGCHQWDGQAECTCARVKAVAATLERAGESPADAARMAHEAVNQPDERAAEADMRAAFLQQMGEPWETALDAKRRIWSIAWGTVRATQQATTGDEPKEGYAFRSDGKLWVVTDPAIAMKWQEQGFEVTPVRAAQQATTGDERAFENDIAFVADHTLARLNKKGCPGEWVDYAYEQIIAAGYIRQQAKSRATTPSPVAGSAGQAPKGPLLREPVRAADMPPRSQLVFMVDGKEAPDQESARKQFLAKCAAPPKPAECAIECPPQSVCDYFAGRGGKDKVPTALSLATDAGAVLTDERRGAISYALGYASSKDGVNPTILEPLRALLAAHPTKQRPDPSDIQGWAVTVNVNAVDILTIGHNSLSGIDNIGDFAEVVRNCAKHLTAFIGDDGTEQRMSDAAGDAERYRWLRARCRLLAVENRDFTIKCADVEKMGSMDAVIDAALKAEIERGDES